MRKSVRKSMEYDIFILIMIISSYNILLILKCKPLKAYFIILIYHWYVLFVVFAFPCILLSLYYNKKNLYQLIKNNLIIDCGTSLSHTSTVRSLFLTFIAKHIHYSSASFYLLYMKNSVVLKPKKCCYNYLNILSVDMIFDKDTWF